MITSKQKALCTKLLSSPLIAHVELMGIANLHCIQTNLFADDSLKSSIPHYSKWVNFPSTSIGSISPIIGGAIFSMFTYVGYRVTFSSVHSNASGKVAFLCSKSGKTAFFGLKKSCKIKKNIFQSALNKI